MKKVVRVLRLQLEAGKATPGKPVGPALAPLGVNIMAFCKDYNEKTATKRGIYPAEVTVYNNRSYDLLVKLPPASNLLREAANIPKGAATPGKVTVGTVTAQQIREIAVFKLEELNATTVESAMRMIAGTARSMGIEVED
jgi:large subunit ribosomal protein L11